MIAEWQKGYLYDLDYTQFGYGFGLVLRSRL